MTNVDYNDGKIHGWNGGACPVHPRSIVKAWFRDGHIVNKEYANNLTWEVDPEDDDPYDIIAFCVVTPCKEPKTIWVNEYTTGYVNYKSEEVAKTNATRLCVRIAVKYQEVIE